MKENNIKNTFLFGGHLLRSIFYDEILVALTAEGTVVM